jgi:Tetratricopeptide repeat
MRAGQEPEPKPDAPEPEPEPASEPTPEPKEPAPVELQGVRRRNILVGAVAATAGSVVGLFMAHDPVPSAALVPSRASAEEVWRRGAELYRRYTWENNVLARELFEEAIRLDPSWGRPYANLAATYRQDWNFEWTTTDPEGLREVEQLAYESAQRAIALDPEQPYGYVQLSYILVYRKGHAEAIQAAQTAIRLGGTEYADGYAVLAQAYTYNGEPELAVPLMEKALQLDTRSPVYYLRQLGQAYYVWGLIAQYQEHDVIRSRGLYQQARMVLERAVLQQSSHRQARLSLAPVYVQLGELDKAQALFAQWPDMARHITMSQRRSHAPYAQEWIRQRYIGALRQAGSSTVG